MTASLLFRLRDDFPLSDEDNHPREQTVDALISEIKMLLISRARRPDIETIPLVNTSVLNYGIDVLLHEVTEINDQRQMLENHLKKTIERFEPRLSQVSVVSSMEDSLFFLFRIRGMFFSTPVGLALTWNICTGRLNFNE